MDNIQQKIAEKSSSSNRACRDRNAILEAFGLAEQYSVGIPEQETLVK